MIVVDSMVLAYLYLPGEFIALTTKLDTRLVTMDKKLLRAFPARAVGLTAV